jgi:hypothetical protein
MIDQLEQPTRPATPPDRIVTLNPTALRALSGIWLFTWRPQLAWRRLPTLFLGLLALPIVIYLTTPSPEGWSQRHTLLGNPGTAVNEFAGRLRRADLQLRPEQRQQLVDIFSDEFARSQVLPPGPRSPEADATRQKDEIKACYERIQPRVQTVLDEAQFAQFQTFARRSTALQQQRVRVTWGRTEPFYHWLIDFYFFVILPLQCVRGTGGLIRDELQSDTLGFLLTRPLSRARLLILKYLTQTAWLQIVLAVETLLIFAAGGLRQIPALASLLPLFLAVQLLAVMVWSALGVCLGQATKRYVALALLYGLIIETGIGRIPTNINTLSMIRHLKVLLSHNDAIETIYQWTNQGLPLSLTALSLATILFLALASGLFTFIEYHHTVEMQK